MATINNIMRRGALIVFEGCDRVGKTTISKMLVKHLNDIGHNAEYMNFPARDTLCGKLINGYLTNKQDMCDESIHLLFSLNRWELQNQMIEKLKKGITLIVDRYSYSGVAFSAAKGLNYEWCKAPEKGLLKPDLVIFLTVSISTLRERGGFGDERYEVADFQEKVLKTYAKLKASYWKEIEANKDADKLTDEISTDVLDVIKNCTSKPLETLW